MKVFALIGESGTGKSHKALLIAHQENIEYIIDDGLLIKKDKILAGLSAKKELNKIQAIRRAIFFDKEHAQAVKEIIKIEKPKKIMVLGTSIEMIEKIIQTLELPPLSKVFNIEEVSSEKEIQLARASRSREGTHIIPLPGIEIQRKFPINLVESLEIFYRKRYVNRKIGERTVVRPPFSYFGKLFISESAILDIIYFNIKNFKHVIRIGKTKININDEGILIQINLTLKYGKNIPDMVRIIQENLKKELDYITGINIKKIDVLVENLILEKNKITYNMS
ncbi:MAG: Asp23/Gls24 family envelope stress response protein [Atribacterota bacterium]|nr:Asp23/Gls24 family envelope stress response protein [Atribacterota bacterium]MDD4896324.1 Asp23/Gls24 family envelope stress response protein [Atribacterota bacterium]MDD5638090.1 Asp23/Gls24 family envelope stress response protein [Atribacterota bacterium]